MRRAARFYHQSIQKELNDICQGTPHMVHFMKSYHNVSRTENGAKGYKTTGQPLLDLNFKVSSLRSRGEQEIVHDFVAAFYHDRKHAVKWLFFVRDILEGLGERRTFRVCLQYLAVSQPQIALAVMKLVPEYGRFDDLLVYLDTPLCEAVCAFIKEQLEQDKLAMKEGKPISLLAKWLPGNNTSSAESRRAAGMIAKQLHMSAKTYRKLLASLRAYSKVVEVQISKNQWAQVDYAQVPAKAQLKYDNAFARHDKERRSTYLKEVYLGENHLNTKGLMPYEIVHQVVKNTSPWWGRYTLKENLLAELQWQKLVQEGFQNDWGLQDCIVVADGSGSMYTNVTGSTCIQAIEVCNSLAIYFAEQLKGVFHNKAITFSASPKFIDLEEGKSLKEKLEILLAHSEVANTNIEAVFTMLLAMAVSNQVPAEELPKQVLIISDMEFDMATGQSFNGYHTVCQSYEEKLFEQIARRYRAAGYAMPRLIFWNVCGRTDTIPMVEGEGGLCLLSGFSQNAMKVAGDRKQTDSYQSLLKVLDSPRYEKVENAILPWLAA